MNDYKAILIDLKNGTMNVDQAKASIEQLAATQERLSGA